MFSYRKSKQISWTLNSMTAVGQHHLTLPTYSNINWLCLNVVDPWTTWFGPCGSLICRFLFYLCYPWDSKTTPSSFFSSTYSMWRQLLLRDRGKKVTPLNTGEVTAYVLTHLTLQRLKTWSIFLQISPTCQI